MARGYQNIEKSAFRKGEYVGYSNGRVFYVRRGFVEGWKAIEQGGNMVVLFARTLDGISRLLSSLDPNSAIASAERNQAINFAHGAK